MKLRVVTKIATGLAGVAVISMPAMTASAATTGTETVNVNGGSISLNVTANGSGGPITIAGAALAIALPQFTVTDQRSSESGWNVTADMTGFGTQSYWNPSGVNSSSKLSGCSVQAPCGSSGYFGESGAALTGGGDYFYKVLVSSSTSSTVTGTWSSNAPNDSGGGVLTSVSTASPIAIGTHGITITFPAVTTGLVTAGDTWIDAVTMLAGTVSHPDNALGFAQTTQTCTSTGSLSGSVCNVASAAFNLGDDSTNVELPSGQALKVISVPGPQANGTYSNIQPNALFTANTDASMAAAPYEATVYYAVSAGP